MRNTETQGPGASYMSRALELARRGLESVGPNPMVGAVLVRAGKVIGEGYHRAFGRPHAEVEAIRDAGRRGHGLRGAELYVTLEPCAHHGKTPPCVDAILAAGIGWVHFSVRDPNPLTRGIGPGLLRKNSVRVSEGILRTECTALNAPFFHWIETGMPWVLAKWAMTLDGSTAAPGGASRWITGEAARAHAHGLRRRVDAVLVGTRTAARDDPLLTPRPARGRSPARILLDRRGKLPLDLRLLSPSGPKAGDGRRLYITSERCPIRRRRELATRGCEVLVVKERRGQLDLRQMLLALGSTGISQVLLEGGSTLHGSFFALGLVHEVAVYVAPRVLGSLGASRAVEGSGVELLRSTPWISGPVVKRLGDDLLIQGVVAG